MRYNIKGNTISVLMMYCMVQWIKELSLQIRWNIFLLPNNQNREKNKLVNMVNGNDLMKHN